MKKLIFLVTVMFLFSGCQQIKNYFGLGEQDTHTQLESLKNEETRVPEMIKTPMETNKPSQFFKGFGQVAPLATLTAQSYENLFTVSEKEKKLETAPAKKTVKKTAYNPAVDYIIEKKGKDLWLWIKKTPKTDSVALIVDYETEALKTQYFLRSLLPIAAQKKNQIIYQGKTMGNSQKLYFIASSAPLNHAVMGKAFRLIIPSQVGFGYIAQNTYSEAEIKPGKTEFFIRRFTKPYGQGTYQDTEFQLPQLKNMLVINKKTSPAKKKK